MPAPTVVVADHWALLRLGIMEVLRAGGARVVGDEQHAGDAITRARAESADLVIVGNCVDQPGVAAVRLAKEQVPDARVIALVGTLARDELGALLMAGADGVLLRSVEGDELGTSVDRVMKGERVVAPALVPLLAGAVGPSDAQPNVGLLTSKEREVLAGLAEGRSNREIAETLYVTPATVKTHLSHIYAKLGVRDRREALAQAVSLGLLR